MSDTLNKQIIFKSLLIISIIISVKLFYDNRKLNNRIEQFENYLVESSKQNLKSSDNQQVNIDLEKNKKQFELIFKSLEEIKYKFVTNTQTKSDQKEIQKEKANVNQIKLNLPLLPANIYDPIQCRKSALYFVSTTLCVHDINKDVHVSGSIWRDGVWEPHIIGKKIQCNFIIQYSLLIKFFKLKQIHLLNI